MPRLSKLRLPLAPALMGPLAVLACGGLVACGSSSTGTTGTAGNAANRASAATGSTKAVAPASGATTKAAGATSPPGSKGGGGGSAGSPSSASRPSAPFAARLAAMRACLQKSGITLPTPGSGAPGAALRNPPLPRGMTHARYAEAVRKCSLASAGGSAAAAKRSFSGTRFRQALVVFADCLRRNGVPIPQPNTSGRGPIFSTRGLNTASPKFREARQKCRSTLLTALRATAHSGTGTG